MNGLGGNGADVNELGVNGEGPPIAPGVVRKVLDLAAHGVGVAAQRRVIAAALDHGDDVDPVRLIARLHADPRLRRPRSAEPAAPAAALTPQELADRGIRVAVPGTAGYPSALMRAWPDLGAPLWLFVHDAGGVSPSPGPAASVWSEGRPAAAVVGTRRPTAVGLRLAEELGAALGGAGAVVVSGMARGIDQAAHRGALSIGGVSSAVLGAGFGVDYPRGSRQLRRAVAGSGGLFTELIPGAPPRPEHFLARNRIISGLCDLTVVVEGRARSGALHTARMAASQGRDVWAVPGSPGAAMSQAPLALIRDGAQVVTRVADVVEALGLNVSTSAPRLQGTDTTGSERDGDPRGAGLTAVQRQVLELLGAVPVTVDDLVQATGLTASTVMTALAQLRRRGLAADDAQGFLAVA